jgi:heat shock protein HspQ
VGYYAFSDADNGYVADSSGYNNTGYYINDAQHTSRQEVNLGGGGDAVQISTTDWNAAQGTITLWINGTSMLGSQYIFGHSVGSWSNRIQLYIDNGYLGVGLGDTRSLKTNIQLLSTQTWYHIALSWDGTNYAVYVNGSLIATGTYTGLTLLNNLADIGNTGNTSSRTEGFQGLIDEVRIYNRALTETEISNLALVFLPIGDKTVAEGNELKFAIRTIPNTTMTLADSNLPGSPSFASNTFKWTPGYTNAGTYEVEFASPHGTSMDFEKVAITVTDTKLPDINSPPIGYWKFNESSGSIASDSSANGDTGYLKNGAAWGTGKIYGAVVFSAPNDAVEIKTTNFNLQQGTIEMWVYVQKQTLPSHYFFGHVTNTTNRIQLYDKNGYLCLGLGDSLDTRVNIQRLRNRIWYHIVLTWNKSAYNVYVNGMLKASGTYSGLTAFADHADIGNNGLGRDMGLNGKIDDMRIYNRALNANEIIQLYARQ